MKRHRHYNQGRALILCCFGSVVAQHRYQQLLEQAQQRYPEYEVRLAISSRMVLKRNQEFALSTLPEQLAALDRAGHRQIVVASVYLYPTEEHHQLTQVVSGFSQFSLSRIVATPALLQPVHSANAILTALNQRFNEPGVQNLFIHHGAPDLANSGYSAIWYSQQLLGQLSDNNHCCSLEGASPFPLVKEKLAAELTARGDHRVRLIPMLLVAGNHFVNDVQSIKQDLEPIASAQVAKFDQDDGEERPFCLLDLPELVAVLWRHIDNEFSKLGALA